MRYSLTNRYHLTYGTTRSDRNFVLALILLNVYNLLVNLQDTYSSIPSISKYSVIVLVLILFIIKTNLQFTLSYYQKFLRLLIVIFLIRSCFLLILSFETKAIYFQNVFVNQLFFLPYFIPTVILISQFNIFLIKYLLHVSYFMTLLGLSVKLVFFGVGFDQSLYFIELSIIGSTYLVGGILFMVSHLYTNKSVFRWTFLNLILMIVILAILGRRGGVISGVYILIMFLIIRMRSNVISGIKKKIYLILTGFIILSFAVAYPYLEKNVFVFQRGFNSESLDESRGDVFRAFFHDFSSTTDWVFGRGLSGTVLRSVKIDNTKSNGIENGYLLLILKGGLLYLVPMLLIFLWSSFLGFFRTKNDLTKALAANIFIQILLMFSFGVPDTNTEYVFVFVSVSACFSKSLRRITNGQLIRILNY